MTSSFEYLFVQLQLRGLHFLAGVMYRAPNCGQQDFLSELKQLLDTLIKHQHSIILGDLNINLIETSQQPISPIRTAKAYYNNSY